MYVITSLRNSKEPFDEEACPVCGGMKQRRLDASELAHGPYWLNG